MPDPSIPAVYLVFNGPLGMSPGKMAAQAFQACERLHRADRTLPRDDGRTNRLNEWGQHTTTIARVAKTERTFERVCEEVDGVMMIDEGLTEVEPGSVTCFASWPLLMDEIPQILKNKKVPLL